MSDNVRDIRDVLLGLHSGLVGTHLGDVCKRAADEIDGLRGELAEKDKRIAELEAAKRTYIAPHGYVFTKEQIDAAWRCFEAIRGHSCCRATLKAALYELGIDACEKCGGTGDDRGDVLALVYPCKDCNGNCWVMEER